MKKVLIIFFLLFVYQINFSQSSPCAAVASFCNGTVRSVSDTWTAAGSGIVEPTCASAGAGAFSDQYWIVYTAPATAISVQIDIAATTGGGARPLADPSFQLYSNTGGCGGAFTLIGCYNNDLGGATSESETVAVTGGSTYYIRVFNGGSPRNVSYSGGTRSNEFTACVTSLSLGDTPCVAIPIASFPYTNTNTTVGGSNFMTGGCPGNAAAATGNGNDMFYSITVAADSYYQMSLTGTSATNIMELSVLSAAACGGPWTCMPNGAWAGGLQTAEPTISGMFVVTDPLSDSPCRAVWFQTAGTYYLKIDAGAGVSGAYTLNVDQYSPTALANGGDGCVNATGMSDGIPQPITNNNCDFSSGTDDPDGALICAGTLENTTWLEFQSDGGGSPVTVTVDPVACAEFGYSSGAGFYGGSGQFGIFTSSTDACGGTYTQADPNGCQSLTTGDVYATALPNLVPTTYFLVWDGNGGAECDFTLTATNVIALPAELVSFRGRKETSSNELLWEVASENNLSYYSLESSSNGIDFKSITNIPATGNSSENLFYTYSDFDYHLPRSYYRLKMVDYDGMEKYSNAVVMDRSSEMSGVEVSIYPNPSEGTYTFESFLEADETITYTVLTSLGQVVYNQEYLLQKGKNSMNVDLTNLADGVYFVEVQSSSENKTIQLIKQ